MSDDEGGRTAGSAVGPFLVGLALGAALGALLAPESGSKLRAKVGKRAGQLREDLGEIVDELRTVMATDQADGSPRESLQRRLIAARARRSLAPNEGGAGAGTADTPLA
ncbi:MAG TPA: YtxH domain-containing protein [Gemmatimonadales bacterium]|nr:YtxH domain-containing protein [Gemmatimonadales bacterium]